jgi:hypothetical protein
MKSTPRPLDWITVLSNWKDGFALSVPTTGQTGSPSRGRMYPLAMAGA